MATFHPSTGRRITLLSGEKIEYSDPATVYETFGDGLRASPGDSLSSSGIQQAAITFVQKYLNISSPMGVTFTSGCKSGNMTYAYVQQTDNNVAISNAFANIAWKGELVVAFGHCFVERKSAAATTPTFSINAAISAAQDQLGGLRNDQPAKLRYLANPHGHLALVHAFQIQNDDAGIFYEAFVDAHSGKLLSLNNFVCYTSYKVIPIAGGAMPPDGFQVLTDPADGIASPSGWHTIDTTNTTTTAGNNVISYQGDQSSTTSESSSTLNFNYSFDASKSPADNLDVARVNAFYVADTVHDFFYRYGFTEVAGNYQQYNFNKGGKDGDRFSLSVQHKDLRNNAYIYATPDGQPGTCYLGIFDTTSPSRDCALDQSVIIHELTHGLTTRLTGGAMVNGLQSVESKGLGEGWSDAMADWAYQTGSTIKDYAVGAYVTGDNLKGIRSHPYSTSTDTNPLMYSSVKTRNDVHDIGEVWANILHNVHAALVEKHGCSNTAMTNPDGSEGNIVFLHLFIDALALQPVNPTFVFARQAWIQADANRYNGANEELLWKAFASRGLGFGAADYNDSFWLPSHDKPVIIYSEQTKLPPLKGTDICGVAPGSIVSIRLNPSTIATLFGLVTAAWDQQVKAELINPDLTSQAVVFFDGVERESLSADSGSSSKAITWGPFEIHMTIELTFYHKTGPGASWEISAIKGDKMKEHLDVDLKTATSLIPIDDGGHGFEDYQNTTFNVTRMTLF